MRRGLLFVTTTRPPNTTTTSTTRPPSGPWTQNGSLGSCRIFPADNPWNRDVSTLPVDGNSANYLAAISGLGGNQKLHADFGGAGAYGIPYITAPGTQPLVRVDFGLYGSESDPGPYPIPLAAPVEGGSDRHVVAVDRDHCKLYELFAAAAGTDRWRADSGAVFDLTSNAAGHIDHALRFTVSSSQKAYLHPATHDASSSTDPNLPPMGLRLRLKAGFNVSSYTGQARVVLDALKKYGMIVADNGSNWFISGAQDTRWIDTDLDQLKTVPGSAFEVVNTGEALHK